MARLADGRWSIWVVANIETRYIIVHYPRYSADQADDIRKRLSPFESRLRLITRAGSIELYELTQ
jgi:hypothetical protein